MITHSAVGVEVGGKREGGGGGGDNFLKGEIG